MLISVHRQLRGAGYTGSLNMSTAEARDPGAAADAEFLRHR